MKIKRFFAKDVKSALLQVKDELGDDAVIMSNKKNAGGVEIVAAVDSESVVPRNQAQQHYSAKTQYRQDKPAAADYAGGRRLKEDQVKIGEQSQSPDRNGKPTMTQQFASLLKHYTPNQSGSSESEANSLSSLLQRQGLGSKEQNKNESPLMQRWQGNEQETDQYTGQQSNQLDPTRFIRRNPREEEQPNPEIELMKDDINSIRRLLEHQVSGLMWQEVERREPLRAMLIKRLARMGVSLELADQLACYIPEETPPPKAWKALLGLVSDQIPISKQDILKKGGVVALLGPTGVGKTTTIAKLAARAAMEYGADEIALVTTDTYRIGAHEQLAIYGRIMGCPVKVAKDSKELADVIHQLRNRRLILVDTAGMGQRDVRLSEQLDTLMQDRGSAIRSYLVLPATAQRKVLQETIDHFKRIPLSGCIMTKLDESLSLGEFVSVIVENSLPVSYIANGQRVPEDIVVAQPKYMVAKANELLEKSADNEPHYWSSDSERI